MDERRVFELFHLALDAQPRPGAFDRLEAALAKSPVTLRHRPGLFVPRTRISIAAWVAVLLAVAVAAAFLAAQLYSPVPVKSPPPPPETGNATVPIQTAHFVNGQEGAVVTERGLLITRDGGQRWQLVLKLDWSSRHDFRFLDADHMVVVSTSSGGSKVLDSTADGGASWHTNPISPIGQPNVYGTLFFLDAREGWQEIDSGNPRSPGDITIYHTTDAGTHWTDLWRSGSTPPSGPSPALAPAPNGLVFTDSTHGFMGTFSYDNVGRMYVTRDSGRTWQIAVVAAPPGGWVNGCCGKVITSPGVTMFANRGFVVQGDPNRSAVYTTSDRGQSWANPRLLPTGASQVHFLDGANWWVTGGQNLFETVDAGASWRQVPVQLPEGGSLSLDGLSTPDAQILWGTSYSSVQGVPVSACYQALDGAWCSFLIRSTDGGVHWTNVKLPAT